MTRKKTSSWRCWLISILQQLLNLNKLRMTRRRFLHKISLHFTHNKRNSTQIRTKLSFVGKLFFGESQNSTNFFLLISLLCSNFLSSILLRAKASGDRNELVFQSYCRIEFQAFFYSNRKSFPIVFRCFYCCFSRIFFLSSWFLT